MVALPPGMVASATIDGQEKASFNCSSLGKPMCAHTETRNRTPGLQLHSARGSMECLGFKKYKF